MRFKLVNTGTKFKLVHSWSVTVEWDEYNLKFLHAIDMAITESTPKVRSKQVNGKWTFENYNKDVAAKNPLFKQEDETYLSVGYCFSPDTSFSVKKINVRRGAIATIEVKIVSAANKNIKGRSIRLRAGEFAKVEATFQ